jgi:ABC-type maltose transport system permease subunit
MTRYRLRGLALHAALVLALLVFMFPFVWTILMASNTTADIYRFPPKLTFGGHFGENVRQVLENVAFFQSMANTVVVFDAIRIVHTNGNMNTSSARTSAACSARPRSRYRVIDPHPVRGRSAS